MDNLSLMLDFKCIFCEEIRSRYKKAVVDYVVYKRTEGGEACRQYQ